MQRYGIEQGVDELGSPKFRRIDNHLDNQNNDAAERRQKAPMASVAHRVLVIRALCWIPHSKKVQFHEMYGQPFEAGHAVRLLSLVVDHFSEATS